MCQSNNPTIYTTERTSRTSEKVKKIVLQETSISSRFLQTTIVKNNNNPQACLEIELIYERAKPQKEELSGIKNLSILKKGEWTSCKFDSET